MTSRHKPPPTISDTANTPKRAQRPRETCELNVEVGMARRITPMGTPRKLVVGLAA